MAAFIMPTPRQGRSVASRIPANGHTRCQSQRSVEPNTVDDLTLMRATFPLKPTERFSLETSRSTQMTEMPTAGSRYFGRQAAGKDTLFLDQCGPGSTSVKRWLHAHQASDYNGVVDVYDGTVAISTAGRLEGRQLSLVSTLLPKSTCTSTLSSPS